ncbi:MAG: hypothetical protein ABFS41_00740 [Myxococcota bacterium]
MELSQLGQLGEFIGGIAVLLTLIYLAVQLRQGNQLNQSESIRALLREYNSTLAQIQDPTFTDLFRRGSKDFEGLSRHDQARVHVWLEQLLRTSFAGFALDPKSANPGIQLINGTLAILIRTPGFQEWWRRYHVGYEQLSPGYAQMIEDMGESFPSLYETCPWYEPTEEELRRRTPQ